MGFAPIPRLSQSRMLTVTLWPHSDRLGASAGMLKFRYGFRRRKLQIGMA